MTFRLLLLFLLPWNALLAQPTYSQRTEQVLQHYRLDGWRNPAIGLDKADIQQAVAETQGEDHFKARFLLANYVAYYEDARDAYEKLAACLSLAREINLGLDTINLATLYLGDMILEMGNKNLGLEILKKLLESTKKDKPLYWYCKVRINRIYPKAASLKEFEIEVEDIASKILPTNDYAKLVLIFETLLHGDKALEFLQKKRILFADVTDSSLVLNYCYKAILLTRAFGKLTDIRKFSELAKLHYHKIGRPSLESKLYYLDILSAECRLNNDHQGAFNIASQACIIAGIDTSLMFSIYVPKVSENMAITLLTGLATTHLFLGLDGVKKAFAITERLAEQINDKANRLTDWNIASHYYSKENIAVNRLMHIADYMWFEEGDISYLNRALAYLDVYRGAVIYDQAFRRFMAEKDPSLRKILDLDAQLAQEEAQLFQRLDSADIFTRLANISDQRAEIKASFLEKHLDYFEQKQAISSDFIGEQQRKLEGQGTSVLYYFYHPNFSYRILINSDTLIFSKVHQPGLRPTKVSASMAAYSACIARSPFMEGLEGTECVEDGYALYKLLLGEDIAPFLKERLIITGNGLFDAFPFQALPLDSLGQEYLGLRHRITYTSSMRLLSLMEARQLSPKRSGILGFAPSFLGAAEELPLARQRQLGARQRQLGGLLSANQEELRGIAQLAKGRYFYGEQATQQEFFDQAADYGLIHLATHAKADRNDGRESIFLLSDGKDGFASIYAEDLRKLYLQTHLVCLSACETGLGSQHLTEGTIGFTHAFAAAGAKSISASHWTVEDQSAAEIMQLFYAYLQAGKAKDEALRLAQIDFRQRHATTYRDHPYYWAPFSVYGDASPIALSQAGGAPKALWGLLPLAAAALFWYQRKKKQEAAAA